MERVAIVGGGVIGLATAWALTRRGAAVTIVEPGPPERAASFGNAGWVCPSLADPVPAPGLTAQSMKWMLRPDSPLHIAPRPDPGFLRWLAAFWRHCNAEAFRAGFEATARLGANALPLYDRMRADGVAFEEHRTGILFVYRDPATMRADYAHLGAIAEAGMEVPPLMDGAALHALEPALRPDLAGGWWAREERSVQPATLVAGLTAWLEERGAVFLRASATGLTGANGRVGAVETDAGRLSADQVVVAAGAWTPRVLKGTGVRAPIEAGKGYHLDYAPPPPGLPPIGRPLYLHELRLAVTPFYGRLRLAGTMEFSGLNDRVRPERAAALPRAMAEAVPGWPEGTAGLAPWVGPRPMTPDGLPLIGRAKGWSNLVLAAGHAMLGVTLAASTGDAVAELLGGNPPEVLRPFDPARFA